MKCKYKYKSKLYEDKSCPHDAMPGSNYCIWHQKKDGKDFSGQEIEETDLIEAYLVKANLEEVKFKEHTDLSSANLQGANLFAANLQEDDLKFANLQGADLFAANLQGTGLRYANLQMADLGYANLQRANLISVNLQRSDLRNAYLQGAYLGNSEIQGAVLEYANLQGANLSHSYFQGADLIKTNLQESDLEFANLQGADLSYADLEKTKLEGADLRVAVLYATNIKDAKGLQYAKIGAKYIEEIIADNLNKILSINGSYEIALQESLSPDFKSLELKEDEIKFFISKVEFYLSDKETLKKLYNRRNKIPKLEILKYRLDLYVFSSNVYTSLKNYFKNVGFYDESGIFFIGEFRVRGKINKEYADIFAYVLKKRLGSLFKKLNFRKHKGSSNKGEMEKDNEKPSHSVLFKPTRASDNLNLEAKKSGTLLMDMLKNYFLFSINRILSIISLYGESVWRVFFTAASIILIYASIYSLGGSIIGTDTAVPVHNFWTNLYFSIVTFTTLGYGDLHPVSSIGIRLLAGSEAFLGAFILAYFVVVVSRKITR